MQYDYTNGGWTVSKNVSNYATEIRIQPIIDGRPTIAIEANVFADNVRLECVHIPQSVAYIGHYAFVGCHNLKHVKEIPATVPPIGLLVISHGAFADCSSLMTFQTSRIISLNGTQNFQKCPKLEMIGANYFHGDIPRQAFQGCISLPSLTIEKDSDVKIEQDALDWCSLMKDVYIKAPNVLCDQKTLECLRRKRIHCKPDCNLADLCYEGGEVITT